MIIGFKCGPRETVVVECEDGKVFMAIDPAHITPEACPFCSPGHEVTVQLNNRVAEETKNWRVVCESGCSGPWLKKREDAINAWNRVSDIVHKKDKEQEE